MVTPVTPLATGRVIGRFTGLIGDTVKDTDAEPDTLAFTGTILLTPAKTLFYVVKGSPDPTTVGIEKVTATLDADGYVTLSGATGVRLLAIDPETGKPLQWTASFGGLRLNGSAVTIPDVKFPVSTTVDTDLTLRAAYAVYLLTHAGATYEEYLDTLDLTPVDPTPTGGFGTTPFGTGPFGGTP